MTARALFEQLRCVCTRGRLPGPPDAAFAHLAVVLAEPVPCPQCGGDGLSLLGRQCVLMVKAMAGQPLLEEALSEHRYDIEKHLLHEAEQLCASVEALHDAAELRDGPLEELHELVEEQAAALGVQALVVVEHCRRLVAAVAESRRRP